MTGPIWQRLAPGRPGRWRHGKVVIRDGTVKIPNRILLKLTNEDDKPLEWLLLMDSESVHREVYVVTSQPCWVSHIQLIT